ncbi:hypothetical protein GlitD10_0572 [Gloeomargarita lithophora Alchichica-D10]|uniref:Uncharacterized protein n=1 Tax=Gloeomargarita lithophora Alchichica-D10 TaxID=1188229 RepID=A0A1J0AAD0_9CYAN|nr:hypothetical protein [Gloeomargarita lithophora]APB32886.1 hypothetical protein GlitD10_0572 [Gloeomargarita lithophora Alchichica-D10]
MGKPMGEYLVEAGLLEPSQIEVALREQRQTGRKLGEIIVEHGWLQAQTIEYWMKNVIIPHRKVTTPPQVPTPAPKNPAFHRKPPAPPPLPRMKPPEDTLVIGFEQTSIPPQAVPAEPPPKRKNIQHQETLILERKDLPPLG